MLNSTFVRLANSVCIVVLTMLMTTLPAIAERPALESTEAADAQSPTVEIHPLDIDETTSNPTDTAQPASLEFDTNKFAQDFVFRPIQIRNESQAEYDRNGKISRQHHRFRVHLKARYQGTLSLLYFENPKLTDILTSAGERLVLLPNRYLPRGDFLADRDEPIFGFAFNLRQPSAPCERLELVRGSVDILVGMGEIQTAILKPAKNYFGHPIRIRDFSDSSFSITHIPDDTQMQFRFDRALGDRIADISFYTASNKLIPAYTEGRGKREDHHYIFYQLDWPADGAVVIKVYPEVRTITVPFELREVPLPVQEKTPDPANMVIDLKPADQTLAPLTVNPQAPDTE